MSDLKVEMTRIKCEASTFKQEVTQLKKGKEGQKKREAIVNSELSRIRAQMVATNQELEATSKSKEAFKSVSLNKEIILGFSLLGFEPRTYRSQYLFLYRPLVSQWKNSGNHTEIKLKLAGRYSNDPKALG